MKKLFAALVLVALGALASPSAVPVYDGVGQPDEPYKYVGRTDAPAGPVSATAAATGGTSGGLTVKSAESGPQVLIDLGAGAFAAPAPVTLTATPVAGDGQPAGPGTIDGNVYRVTVSTGARLLPDQAQGFLFLRSAVMTKPNPVIVHRESPTGTWEQVKTQRAGTDILSTPFRALGDYAVVRLPGSKPLASGGGISATRLVFLGSGVLVLVVLTILVLRRSGTD